MRIKEIKLYSVVALRVWGCVKWYSDWIDCVCCVCLLRLCDLDATGSRTFPFLQLWLLLRSTTSTIDCVLSPINSPSIFICFPFLSSITVTEQIARKQIDHLLRRKPQVHKTIFSSCVSLPYRIYERPLIFPFHWTNKTSTQAHTHEKMRWTHGSASDPEHVHHEHNSIRWIVNEMNFMRHTVLAPSCGPTNLWSPTWTKVYVFRRQTWQAPTPPLDALGVHCAQTERSRAHE